MSCLTYGELLDGELFNVKVSSVAWLVHCTNLIYQNDVIWLVVRSSRFYVSCWLVEISRPIAIRERSSDQWLRRSLLHGQFLLVFLAIFLKRNYVSLINCSVSLTIIYWAIFINWYSSVIVITSQTLWFNKFYNLLDLTFINCNFYSYLLQLFNIYYLLSTLCNLLKLTLRCIYVY